jgi:hypothetical protein
MEYDIQNEELVWFLREHREDLSIKVVQRGSTVRIQGHQRHKSISRMGVFILDETDNGTGVRENAR